MNGFELNMLLHLTARHAQAGRADMIRLPQPTWNGGSGLAPRPLLSWRRRGR